MPLDLYDSSDTNEPAARDERPFIGVFFECCKRYARIYREPDAEEYAGRCPGCLAMVRARVGPDGTSQRIFRAS